MPNQPSTENINNSYFEGYYKDIWRQLNPEGLTKAEVLYLIQEGKLSSSSRVLDLMCGYGRHSVPLAEQGINVTAVDNLDDYIQEISSTADQKKLPIDAIQSNVLDFEPEGSFEMAICMGNSLCFFNEEETNLIFDKVSSHLKPAGKFIISTLALAEIVLRDFKSKLWTYVGDMKYLTDSSFHFNPSRIETESTIITANGDIEVKRTVDYIYTLNEIETMLRKNKLTMTEVYSIPGKKKFTLGEPRAYIVAERSSL